MPQIQDTKEEPPFRLNIFGGQQVHPRQALVYLLAVASGILFLMLLLLFVRHLYLQQKHEDFQMMLESGLIVKPFLPRAFVWSTLLMIGSGILVASCNRAFRKGTLRRAFNSLAGGIVLGIAFALVQLLAWIQLFSQGVFFSGGYGGGAYLYFFSGLHLLHVAAGFVLLGERLYTFRKHHSDAADELILTTNPFELVKTRVAAFWWHYTDVLWLVLFIVFTFVL